MTQQGSEVIQSAGGRQRRSVTDRTATRSFLFQASRQEAGSRKQPGPPAGVRCDRSLHAGMQQRGTHTPAAGRGLVGWGGVGRGGACWGGAGRVLVGWDGAGWGRGPSDPHQILDLLGGLEAGPGASSGEVHGPQGVVVDLHSLGQSLGVPAVALPRDVAALSAAEDRE